MTAPLRPAPSGLYGSENWIIVLSVASTAYIPTAAEVIAGTALDVTRIVFADSGRPTQSTNRVKQERRLGDTQLAEFIGNSEVTGGEMHYAFRPQDAVGGNGKKMYEKIPAGTNAFLVERGGVARDTTPAAGQFVNCYPVQFGPSFPAPAGDAESMESGMTCTFAVTDVPAISVALT